MNKSALLLVGSPRREKSNSKSLGDYLLKSLSKKGLETRTIQIYDSLKSKENIEELIKAVNKHDLIIIAAPLYVDSIPASVIKALEIIYENRKNNVPDKKQSLISIVNCGFPESYHNNTATSIYKYFAKKAKFNWKGGLSLGQGEAKIGRAHV